MRGKRVLVTGSGPIGALIVAVLKRAGAAEITAVDLHEVPLGIARALGATGTLNTADAGAVAAVEADVTLESSGSPRGLASAIAGSMAGGRLVMVGLQPAGEQPVPIATAITRELELPGSYRFNNEIDDVITALADGTLQAEAAITHEYHAADALEAFTTARDAATSGKVLLRF